MFRACLDENHLITSYANGMLNIKLLMKSLFKALLRIVHKLSLTMKRVIFDYDTYKLNRTAGCHINVKMLSSHHRNY